MILFYLIISFIVGILLTELFRCYFGFQSFLKRQKKSWIGFDLDGTLAVRCRGIFNPRDIGEPIPVMIELIKKYINEGKDVKILTARVSTNGTVISIYNAVVGQYYIRAWCKKHIGQKLDVVSVKDFRMQLLYDDCVVQVKTDTGELI